MYEMSFPRANIGRWGKGRGEDIAIFLMLISTSHVEQLCSSLSQTNSMIVAVHLYLFSITPSSFFSSTVSMMSQPLFNSTSLYLLH